MGLEKKRKLLAEAKCVLVTSTVPETSSLVAMEALASGAPVIAFPNGALAEIVEHGRTGFLVRNEKEMADGIAASGTLNPDTTYYVRAGALWSGTTSYANTVPASTSTLTNLITAQQLYGVFYTSVTVN